MEQTIIDLLYKRLFEYRKNQCEGCYYNSLSQKHHTCLDTRQDEVNYFSVICDLHAEKIITRDQFNLLTEYNLHNFENGASASGLF